LVLIFSVAPAAPSSLPTVLRWSSVTQISGREAPSRSDQRRPRHRDELKRDGFTVDVGENLTGDGMRRAFDKLYGRIKPAPSPWFSLAVRRPVQPPKLHDPDRRADLTEPDVRRDGFSLETILGEINSRGAGVKIALVDASGATRSNAGSVVFRRPRAGDRRTVRW